MAVLVPRFVIETLIIFSIALIYSRSAGLAGSRPIYPPSPFGCCCREIMPMSNRVMNSIGVIRSQIPSIAMVSKSLITNSSKDENVQRTKAKPNINSSLSILKTLVLLQ